jgi:hypothetical protein
VDEESDRLWAELDELEGRTWATGCLVVALLGVVGPWLLLTAWVLLR